MTDQEFHDRIRSGEIGPQAQFRAFESEEWMTVNNLPEFHRFSSVDHPPGKDLEQRLRQAFVHEITTTTRFLLMNHYRDDVERRYQLDAVDEIAKWPGVLGVARCVFLPSFEPEAILTLAWRSGGVEVEYACGATSLWDAIRGEDVFPPGYPDEEQVLGFIRRRKGHYVSGSHCAPGTATNFDPVAVNRKKRQMAEPELSSRFMSLQALLAEARSAPSCSTNAYDGIGYRHTVIVEGQHVQADWSNPAREEFPEQARLATAYRALVDGLFGGWSER
jgi:hypothetical protein